MAATSRQANLQVQTQGLKDFQREMKKLGPEAAREIGKAKKGAAQVVASASGRHTTKATGRMAAGYRALASGVVVNKIPWAGVQHFGGNIAPNGGRFYIKPQFSVYKAMDEKSDQVVDKLGDGVDRAAKKHGFK